MLVSLLMVLSPQIQMKKRILIALVCFWTAGRIASHFIWWAHGCSYHPLVRLWSLRSPSCSTCQRYFLLARTGQETRILYRMPVLGVNRSAIRWLYACCRILLEVGPPLLQFMSSLLNSDHRLYFYVEFAFACALLIMAFIFVEESAYKRIVVPTTTTTTNEEPSDSGKGYTTKGQTEHVEVVLLSPPRKTFIQTLKPWSGVDPEAEFFMTMLRSFSYFLVPSVLWVVTSFGTSPRLTLLCAEQLTEYENENRHLHRSRSARIQLHIPHQNRRTSLQLEPEQRRSHSPRQHNRLRTRRPFCLFLGPHSRLPHQTQQQHSRSGNASLGTPSRLPSRSRRPHPLRFHCRTQFALDRLFCRRGHDGFCFLLLFLLCIGVCCG
jgi:hypothetical protein